MIRLRALNEESSEESEEEEIPLITKEAQEQTAFAQYNEALAMLREKNLEGARTLFQALLENSFLVEITKQDGTKGLGHPALVLKYSCFKNMGTLLEKQGELQGALQHYLQAAELDGSDVTLWYRIGTVAVSVIDYELACDAFLEGLRCSPRHWPCLDNLVTILYVLNAYVPCLLYIARAFELDPDFAKGLAFRDKILTEQPSIIHDFNLYCKGYDLGSLDTKCDGETGKEFIEKALEMREKKRKLCSDVFTPKPLQMITLVQALSAKTWLSLGESLVQLHQHIEANGNIRHFCCPVDLEATARMVNQTEKDLNPTDEAVDVEQAANEDVKVGGNEEAASLAPGEEEGAADARGTPEGEDAKSRKRRRSSLSFLEQWMWGGKRRSARVRSTIKRETEKEDSNLQEALRRLVPRSLLPDVMKDDKRKEIDSMKSSENSLDTMDLYKLYERRESTEGRSDDNHRSAAASPRTEKEEATKVLSEEGYFGSEKENNDVQDFIQSNTRCDIIDLLTSYVKSLSSKWQLLWPTGLPAVFIQAYECMRQHVSHPSAFSSDEDADWLREDAYITLLYGELLLDRLLQDKAGYEGQIPAESIGQLVFLSGREGLFQGEHLKYMLRLCWLKAHLFVNQGSSEIAMQSLHTILGYIDERCDTNDTEKIFLPNCKHHNHINKEIAQKLLAALMRNQSLYEVQHLYDEQHYDKVVEILQETFPYSQQLQLPPALSNNDSCPDRATQLAMLMDSLWQLKRYQDCFYWGEACCNEALHKYLNSEDKEQSKWASAVEKLLSGLESCVNKAGLTVIDNMPNNRLAHLVQNLTLIVCHQLDAPETAVEMPIESISPWILLQQILQQKGEKGKSASGSDEDEEQDIGGIGELPAYISILFTAHEFLGRRSWCCSSEGALLLHTMDVVIPRLKDEKFALVRDRLKQGLEQAFFCLYAHPSKKTKARYLQDHGVPQIPLTWERGMQLYQFYLPDELPEFDSYRVSSISADVECLLKRIAALVPSHYKPAHLVEKVMAYIDGTSPSFPVLDVRNQLPRSMSAIYYLLADYYFKVNEWGKAIRHYLLDVCVSPVRIDSWAGMALARGSQLETKLNSCVPLKSEMEFLRQASTAQRCFQRALDIDATHSLMWIEYGSFVYMVHSFCSRLLKQETDSLSLEMFEVLENRKEMMLDIAVKCFTTASKIWYTAGENSGIQDERWLHHYMLGKVAEKRDHDPSVFLGHFTKASEHLHQTRASYVRKISYSNPQNFAVEALEVYYRIHACILKYLEQNEGRKLEDDVKTLFEKLLKDTAEGPFMASSSRETDGKVESDDEHKKRRPHESSGGVFEGVPLTKKARLDLPLDVCVMEDVIDVMEDLITKVTEMESRRNQSPCTVPTSDNVTNVNPLKSKSGSMEIIVLDESLPKAFEYQNEMNVQIDPLSTDIENVVIKKEPVTEMVVCKEVIRTVDAEGNLDDIDLAMEVVEEIVVEEVIVDDELDQISDGEHKANECEEQITEFQPLQASTSVMDAERVKVQPDANKCPQLIDAKAEASGDNGNGEDGDDECEDDDDEYDGDDDDDDEEEGRDVKKNELRGGNGVTSESKPPTLTEQQPDAEDVENVIPEASINRRSSQESTTTTTTTTTTETSTANSSSSSSDSEGDSSSSNEDSSNSSSNSDSDNASESNSEEAEQTAATPAGVASSALADKKMNKIPVTAKREGAKKGDHVGDDEQGPKHDHYELVQRCLVALEECVLRFPQHYKSLYRLTHFYFHSKFHRNISKCQDLLLGTYKCLPMEGRSASARFQGLFADRKSSNFFNGVWRIPVSEIDRPGSFASHMSRCVLLLMEVLREVRDHRMLLELCLQLRRTPEADKKYLRDSEREQLCRQALTLALQALRAKLRDGPVTSGLVVEIYRVYLRIQRHMPQKESIFASLLCEAYIKHTKVEAVVLDQAIRFCQKELIASRTGVHPPVTTAVATTVSQPVVTMLPTTTGASANMTTHQQRKTITPVVKPAVALNPSSTQPPPRSRGRPPSVSHVSGTVTPLSSKSHSSSSRCNVQSMSPQQLGSIIPPNLSTPPLSYYPFHTLFSDPSLITAAVQSKLPAMLDQQVAALNFLNLHSHVGGYQAEFLRHFSTSISDISTPIISNIPTSESQKSPGAVRSGNNSFVGNKGISGLPSQQCTHNTSASLPTSISITPLPLSQPSVPCNTGTPTSSSTIYSNSMGSKSVPSLQQKLQASQAFAKSASSRSSILNPSSSMSKPSSQMSTVPLTGSTSLYTPPDQALFTPQPPKSSSNPNSYISLLKSNEGMRTVGMSISQVTATPVNTTASIKSASKLVNFRKHSIPSLQGNQIQDQSSDSKDVTNVAPSFKDSHSDISKIQGRSDGSPVTKNHDVPSKTATPFGSFSQGSGCKLPATSASSTFILSGQTQMIAVSRSQSSLAGQDSSVYKETQATTKSFVQRGQISELPVTKNKSPESSVYKSQSGTKGSRSPASMRNIGHEITLTPSLPQSATTTVSNPLLSHLHQQSTELKIITKPKSATLDLPVTLPSSITITPKQQGTPDGCSKKKYKDSVSITEIGRKVPAGSQVGAKRVGGPSAIRQDRIKEEREDDKHGVGDNVEVITLE